MECLPPAPPHCHSLWFPKEVILAHNRDEETNKAFNCHGNQATGHNVPLKG